MPELRPFRGLRYDVALLPDVGAALCPPYDVISPAQREELLSRSKVNAVRLELPAASVDAATADDYRRAAAALAAWQADGTLRRDEQPIIYVYEQSFAAADGSARVARSFFSRLRLEDYGPQSAIRPHERTLSAPREHRFRLLSEVRTHLSPVLMLYDDGQSGALSAALLDALTEPAPDLDTLGPGGVGQRLWAVDPRQSVEAGRLLEAAANSKLDVADGHHRYETALRYRDTPGAPDDAQFVLALLYEARSGGLELAPWHRVISGVDDPAAALDHARELFDYVAVDDPGPVVDIGRDAAQDEVALGVWTREGGALLTIDRARAAPFVADASSDAVRWLDVSVLSGTLGPMIGATEGELALEGRLTYTHDAPEAVALVEGGRADLCFVIRPSPIEQVLAVAAAGDFMPPKSTYFYPKAATGLVFDPLA